MFIAASLYQLDNVVMLVENEHTCTYRKNSQNNNNYLLTLTRSGILISISYQGLILGGGKGGEGG